MEYYGSQDKTKTNTWIMWAVVVGVVFWYLKTNHIIEFFDNEMPEQSSCGHQQHQYQNQENQYQQSQQMSESEYMASLPPSTEVPEYASV